MELQDFLRKSGVSYAEFAKNIGVNAETVRRYAEWERCPRPAIMRRIVQTTQGYVTPNDFYRLPMGFESGPSWVGVDPAASVDE